MKSYKKIMKYNIYLFTYNLLFFKKVVFADIFNKIIMLFPEKIFIVSQFRFLIIFQHD